MKRRDYSYGIYREKLQLRKLNPLEQRLADVPSRSANNDTNSREAEQKTLAHMYVWSSTEKKERVDRGRFSPFHKTQAKCDNIIICKLVENNRICSSQISFLKHNVQLIKIGNLSFHHLFFVRLCKENETLTRSTKYERENNSTELGEFHWENRMKNKLNECSTRNSMGKILENFSIEVNWIFICRRRGLRKQTKTK